MARLFGAVRIRGTPSPNLGRVPAQPGLQVGDRGGYRSGVRCNHLTPEELEYEIDGSDWADAWECSESPQARAYSLLKELNLGCSMDQEGKKEGRVEFIEGGWHPGSSECWVELRNDLTVSLLQAHIIERDLPIKITFDEA